MHLAYFYCNFQAERLQTTEYVIGSLLKQLVSKSYSYETPPHPVWNIYERQRTQQISLQLLKLFDEISMRFSQEGACRHRWFG